MIEVRDGQTVRRVQDWRLAEVIRCLLDAEARMRLSEVRVGELMLTWSEGAIKIGAVIRKDFAVRRAGPTGPPPAGAPEKP